MRSPLKPRHDILAARQLESDPHWGSYRDFRGVVRRHLASMGRAHSEAHVDEFIHESGLALARKLRSLLRKDLSTRTARRLLRRSANN